MPESQEVQPTFLLWQEEADYLVACVHGTVDLAVELANRRNGIFAGHLQVLLEASDLWEKASDMEPTRCPWPWPTREALGQSLLEAVECLHGKHRSPSPTVPAGTAIDGFGQEEIAFLLRWYQEDNDRFWTPNHCDDWYPASQALRRAFPTVTKKQMHLICLAAFDRLGLNHWDATGLLLSPEVPPLPWSDIAQLDAKQREVDAWRNHRRERRQLTTL